MLNIGLWARCFFFYEKLVGEVCVCGYMRGLKNYIVFSCMLHTSNPHTHIPAHIPLWGLHFYRVRSLPACRANEARVMRGCERLREREVCVTLTSANLCPHSLLLKIHFLSDPFCKHNFPLTWRRVCVCVCVCVCVPDLTHQLWSLCVIVLYT